MTKKISSRIGVCEPEGYITLAAAIQRKGSAVVGGIERKEIPSMKIGKRVFVLDSALRHWIPIPNGKSRDKEFMEYRRKYLRGEIQGEFQKPSQ